MYIQCSYSYQTPASNIEIYHYASRTTSLACTPSPITLLCERGLHGSSLNGLFIIGTHYKKAYYLLSLLFHAVNHLLHLSCILGPCSGWVSVLSSVHIWETGLSYTETETWRETWREGEEGRAIHSVDRCKRRGECKLYKLCI